MTVKSHLLIKDNFQSVLCILESLFAFFVLFHVTHENVNISQLHEACKFIVLKITSLDCALFYMTKLADHVGSYQSVVTEAIKCVKSSVVMLYLLLFSQYL